MIWKHSNKESWSNKKLKLISLFLKVLNTENPESNLLLILQAQWFQTVHGSKLTSKNSIQTQKVLKSKMEIFIFLWKLNNNLLKSSHKWDSKKWKLIVMLSHLSGTLMLFSNLKLIQPETLMIHSLLVNQNKQELMTNNTSKKSRMFTRKEVTEV